MFNLLKECAQISWVMLLGYLKEGKLNSFIDKTL